MDKDTNHLIEATPPKLQPNLQHHSTRTETSEITAEFDTSNNSHKDPNPSLQSSTQPQIVIYLFVFFTDKQRMILQTQLNEKMVFPLPV